MREPAAASDPAPLTPSFRALLFLSLLLCSLIPLRHALLPLVDLPQHLAILQQLRAAPGHFPELQRHLGPFDTNSLLYWLGDLSAGTLSPFNLCRAALAFYLLGTPLCLALLCRAYRRPAELAAAVVPCLWCMPVMWGFINYAVSIPLSLGYLALAEFVARGFDEEKGKLGWTPLLLLLLLQGLLACACYYAHAQTWLFLGGSTVLLATLRPARTRSFFARVGLALAPLLPSLLLLLTWARAHFVERSHHGRGVDFGKMDSGLEPVFRSPFLHLQKTGVYLVLGLPPWLGNILVVFLVAAILLAYRYRQQPSAFRAGLSKKQKLLLLLPSVRPWSRDRGPWAWFFASFALYLFLPWHIKGQFFISTRMIIWLAPSLILAVATRFPVRIEKLIWAALSMASCLVMLNLELSFSRFEADYLPVLQMLRKLPRHKVLLQWDDQALPLATPAIPALAHFASYYAVERDGQSAFSFAEYPAIPLQYTAQGELTRVRQGEEYAPQCAALREGDRRSNYLLFRHVTPQNSCVPIATYHRQLRLIDRQGSHRLYQIKEPLPAHPELWKACGCPAPAAVR